MNHQASLRGDSGLESYIGGRRNDGGIHQASRGGIRGLSESAAGILDRGQTKRRMEAIIRQVGGTVVGH